MSCNGCPEHETAIDRALSMIEDGMNPAEIVDSLLAEAIEDDPEKWRKFWASLTGPVEHKITKCIERLGDKPEIQDAGAMCGKLGRMFGSASTR